MAETRRKGHRNRKRAEYERLFAEHARSGLSLRAFAESKGIKPRTFYAWHRELRPGRRKPVRPQVELAPVELVAASSKMAPARRASEVPFEIVLLGGRTVRVPAGFDAGELGRLLCLLESSC